AGPLAGDQSGAVALRAVPAVRPEVRRAEQLLPEHARERGDADGAPRPGAARTGGVPLPGADRAELRVREAALPGRPARGRGARLGRVPGLPLDEVGESLRIRSPPRPGGM